MIGASRITYAMASYRQLPEVFRRLHPRFKTPWLALVVFAGIASIAVILPGQTNFLGTMYAFGAMLSFTIAHAAIVALRVKGRGRGARLPRAAEPRLGGIDWPLFAILGGLGTARRLARRRRPGAGDALGRARLARDRLRHATCSTAARLQLPLRQTVRAPAIVLGLEVEYRTILVPVLRTAESEEALVAAARLASERRARIVILHVLEVPLDQPLDAELHERRRSPTRSSTRRRRCSRPTRASRSSSRLERARSAGPAIVEEAARRDAEVVILGASRTKVRGGKPIFGRTVDYVLRNAPTRVAVVAGKQAA